MKTIVIAALSVLATAAAAAAQTAPDLKGVWSGPVRTVIYGHNPHHPGPADANTPRIREITYTYDVEGQDGQLLWGKSWSSPDNKEPFAAMIGPNPPTNSVSNWRSSMPLTVAAEPRKRKLIAGPTKSAQNERIPSVPISSSQASRKVKKRGSRKSGGTETTSSVGPSTTTS